jgi:hypothetical protein
MHGWKVQKVYEVDPLECPNMKQAPRDNALHLIAGSGRSGTTWMLDVLAEANGLRPVFEPLHPEVSAVGRQFGYSYLVRDSHCAELKNMFAAAAHGALSTVWTDYRIQPGRLRLDYGQLRSLAELKGVLRRWRQLVKRYAAYRHRKARQATIVKCIRANLMLDWVHANFDARIVFLMRHPGAAVESRLRFADHWDPFPLLQRYHNDAALMDGALRGQIDWLTRDLSRAEALTLVWCIENVVPASQVASNGYVVAFYEEMLEQPGVEWARVVQGLGLSEMPGDDLLGRPSQQSAVVLQECKKTETYLKSYARWRERLSPGELADIDGVLKMFGVDFYSVAEDRPDRAGFARTYLVKEDRTAGTSAAGGGPDFANHRQ